MFVALKPGFRSLDTLELVLIVVGEHTGAKQINAKWQFKVIQGHVFWTWWKGNKGVMQYSNNVGHLCPGLRKIHSSSEDPKYSADHGPLPHVSADDVMQKYSINTLCSKYIK